MAWSVVVITFSFILGCYWSWELYSLMRSESGQRPPTSPMPPAIFRFLGWAEITSIRLINLTEIAVRVRCVCSSDLSILVEKGVLDH